MNLSDSVDKLGPLDVPSATSLTDAASDSSRFNTAFCFPFESLLLALNTTRFDYFSLDVQGFELDIRKTIPFDRLDVDVISCRLLHSRESTKAYNELLSQHGYDRYPDFSKTDFIFAKTYLLRRQNLAPAAATAAAAGGRQDEFKPSRVEQRHIEDDVAQGKLDSQMDLQRQFPAGPEEDQHNAAADRIDDKDTDLDRDDEVREMANNKFIIYENER